MDFFFFFLQLDSFKIKCAFAGLSSLTNPSFNVLRAFLQSCGPEVDNSVTVCFQRLQFSSFTPQPQTDIFQTGDLRELFDGHGLRN